jgi:hypothetical protein
MRIWKVWGVLALCAATGAADAQSVGRMLADDFKNAGKDVVAIWGSPFDASGRDWLLAAGAFGAFGVSMLADKSVSDWAIKNDSSTFFRAIKPVRRGGKLFSGQYVVPPVAAVYVIGIVTKNQGLRDFVMGCMSSWAAQSAVRKTVYVLAGRALPDTMPDDPQHWKLLAGDNWMMHSFPRGTSRTRWRAPPTGTSASISVPRVQRCMRSRRRWAWDAWPTARTGRATPCSAASSATRLGAKWPAGVARVSRNRVRRPRSTWRPSRAACR